MNLFEAFLVLVLAVLGASVATHGGNPRHFLAVAAVIAVLSLFRAIVEVAIEAMYLGGSPDRDEDREAPDDGA